MAAGTAAGRPGTAGRAMSGAAFTTGTRTHAGCVRPQNEDSLLARPDLGLWVVADGMGGHAAGDVASRLLIEAFAHLSAPQSASEQRAEMFDRLAEGHQHIVAHAIRNGIYMMGTTVAALAIHDGETSCLWSGDSRIYMLRQGRISALTRDHSEVALMVESGILTPEEARLSPRRNMITRAVGIGADPQAEIVTLPAEDGDRLLLCSDGLTEHLRDDEIAALLDRPGTPQAIADAMVSMTLDRGARDNVTVIVVDYAAANAGATAARAAVRARG